jgi:hypothetical protein
MKNSHAQPEKKEEVGEAATLRTREERDKNAATQHSPDATTSVVNRETGVSFDLVRAAAKWLEDFAYELEAEESLPMLPKTPDGWVGFTHDAEKLIKALRVPLISTATTKPVDSGLSPEARYKRVREAVWSITAPPIWNTFNEPARSAIERVWKLIDSLKTPASETGLAPSNQSTSPEETSIAKGDVRRWGIEWTDSRAWVGPMRKDGSGKVSEVIYSFYIGSLMKPEVDARNRGWARLIVNAVNAYPGSTVRDSTRGESELSARLEELRRTLRGIADWASNKGYLNIKNECVDALLRSKRDMSPDVAAPRASELSAEAPFGSIAGITLPCPTCGKFPDELAQSQRPRSAEIAREAVETLIRDHGLTLLDSEKEDYVRIILSALAESSANAADMHRRGQQHEETDNAL